MPEQFIVLTGGSMFQVILLGFIGGVLSGFIGSGGAFFMTPGMMNIGVPGVVAVGSNITHKFGKALIGSHRHKEMGNVDTKLGVFMLLTAAAGINLAVWMTTKFFSSKAATDLYISCVFTGVLVLVGFSMLRDIIRSAKSDSAGPSRRLTEAVARLHLPPIIYFPTADVKVSLWVVLLVGLATGFLAGTIGVGGFVGVPAMIYVFGVAASVAAGTELYLAVFMGAWGALNYAFQGKVDLRLTLLLYMGSLMGVHLGAYGTKVVKEVVIRLVTSLIILICVLSRAVNIPVYLRQLGWVKYEAARDAWFNGASKVLLFMAGIAGCGVILVFVVRAYIQRRRVHATLAFTPSRSRAEDATAHT